MKNRITFISKKHHNINLVRHKPKYHSAVFGIYMFLIDKRDVSKREDCGWNEMACITWSTRVRDVSSIWWSGAENFQQLHRRFADESRNPFGMSRNHSLWHVILTPYNLPPGMCIKKRVHVSYNLVLLVQIILDLVLMFSFDLWLMSWSNYGLMESRHLMCP